MAHGLVRWEQQLEYWNFIWQHAIFERMCIFFSVKQQHGGCVKSVSTFRFNGYNWWTIGSRYVKFWIAIGHKRTYKFCVKYCKSTVTDEATMRIFEVMSDKFNVDRIFIIRSSQKRKR
jgi:hypothetical protein